MAKKEQCFIITPIGDDTDPIRRHIDGIIEAAITPALGDEYEIIVAHKMGDLGSITKQVIDKVYHSKLVIANLTNRNPNVMYELALRHATGKPAIMIAERGTPLPSDIIMQRTIFYYNDAKGVLELRDELKKAVSTIDFEKKDGPIVDVLGDISHDAAMLKKVAEKDSDSREPLEYIMRRLDRIEALIPARPETSVQSYSKNYATITYEEAPPIFPKDTELLDRFSAIDRKLPGFRMSGVRISSERKEIYVYFNYDENVGSLSVFGAFLRLEMVTALGFKGVKVSFE